MSCNLLDNVPEIRYKLIDEYIKIFNLIAGSTYHSLYVIDHLKHNFLYVSINPLFLCGHTPEEVREMGFSFYAKYIPEEELKMLTEVNNAYYSFLHKFPDEEKSNYILTYDFHLCMEKRKKKLVNHKIIPFLLADEDKHRLSICIVSASPNKTPGNAFIQNRNLSTDWEYCFEKHRWNQKATEVLKEREKDILLLSAQGFTMNEIADELCLAIDTVKFTKKRLFQKINATNITEALFYATNHRLI